MPQTKEYDRWCIESAPFGLIASPNCAVAPVDSQIGIAPTANVLTVWNFRTGEKLGNLESPENEHQVTSVKLSHKQKQLAVGFHSGTVKLFERRANEHGDSAVESGPVIFHGHTAGVISLIFSADDLTLASGGNDTAVILWDIVNECGLFRLNGHKAPITGLAFTHDGEYLLSSGKDCFVKFWSMKSQSCFYTLADHKSEIHDIALMQNDTRLVCASTQMELSIYKLHWLQGTQIDAMQVDSENDVSHVDGENGENNEGDKYFDQANSIVRCRLYGTLLRQSKGRAKQLAVSQNGRLFVCVGQGNTVDLFAVYGSDQVKKRRAKKFKSFLRTRAENPGAGPIEDVQKSGENLARKTVDSDLSVEFARLGVYKCRAKARAAAFAPNARAVDQNGALEEYLFITLSTNDVQVVHLSANPITAGTKFDHTDLQSVVPNFGHRGPIRCVAFSNDNLAVFTGANDGVKVWNRGSQQCSYTSALQSPCVSGVFLPGDKHLLVGTQTGHLHLLHLAHGGVVEQENAVRCVRDDQTSTTDDCPIWGICLTSDKKGAISGGADQKIHIWKFELATDSVTHSQQLILASKSRKLSVGEDILCVASSHTGKFLLAGLLDNTAKVFFSDTFKHHLTLYGHSLPVLSISVSSDDNLIATCSADKTIKLWGLDFGDCHKTLLAHDDSVTCVRFVSNTHELLSCGKDGFLRRWDADKFHLIQSLNGAANRSNATIWQVAISRDGKFACSVNADCSVRLWQNTEEMLILHEEQEMEREKLAEEGAVQHDEPVVGESGVVAQLAGSKSTDTVRATENILEALEIIRTERLALSQDKGHKITHPIYVAYKCTDLNSFFAEILKRIKSSELEKCLLMLPLGDALEAMSLLADCVQLGQQVELCARAALFLLRVNHSQLLSSSAAVPIVEKMKRILPSKISELRNLVGINLAALKIFQSELEIENDVQLFLEAGEKVQKRKKKHKNKSDAAYVMTMSL